jgi:hypothetical protein
MKKQNTKEGLTGLEKAVGFLVSIAMGLVALAIIKWGVLYLIQ